MALVADVGAGDERVARDLRSTGDERTGSGDRSRGGAGEHAERQHEQHKGCET